MPVYLRKGSPRITPATFTEFASDDEDYIQDPDQWRDLLPQPYRSVDKVLTWMLDEIWAVIADREAERNCEMTRNLPPLHDKPEKLQGVDNVTALCATPDGKLLLATRRNGIAAVDTSTMEIIDSWEDANLDLVSLSLVQLNSQCYLVGTVDDIGVARLLMLSGGRFYLIKRMNEEEGEKRILAVGLHLASGGDHCALILENPGTKDVWIEVHRVPKEQWAREAPVPSRNSESEGQVKTPVVDNAANEQQGEEDGDNETLGSEDRVSAKFSPLTLVLKVKPLPLLTVCQASNLTQAMKSIDITGDVVGTGINHLFNQSHRDLSRAIFEKFHAHQLQYLPKDSPVQTSYPTLHFLRPGRNLCPGVECSPDDSASICVWWSGNHRLLFYSLHKQGKDVEHKPDIVRSFGAPITASGTSPCTGLVAIGLQSGICIVYDNYLGIHLRVSQLCPQPLVKLEFVNPFVYHGPLDNFHFALSHTDVKNKVLVVSKTMDYFLIDCAPSSCDKLPHRLVTNIRHPEEEATWVGYLRDHPQLVGRVSHQGHVTLHDVIGRQEICRLSLPPPCSLADVWQPHLVAVGGPEHLLFLRGTEQKLSEDGTDAPQQEESIWFFKLKNLPNLQPYCTAPWNCEEQRVAEAPCHPNLTLITRADAALAARFASHDQRQMRLKQRWGRLSETLEAIQAKKMTLKDVIAA